MHSSVNQLKQYILHSDNIVFFGGAGVSTASGIPDFRSADGLFGERLNRSFTPEQLVSRTFYERYPEDFFAFYREKLLYPDARPNACHLALARLEALGKLSAVITQNIDGLHQAAGSNVVYELHGCVHRNYCENCHTLYDEQIILNTTGIPKCPKCSGRIKPDVVLYEESLDERVIAGAISAISAADMLIIGGTSLVVYPAAGFIHYFQGPRLVLINKSETSADNAAQLVIRDDIASVFQQLMQDMDS